MFSTQRRRGAEVRRALGIVLVWQYAAFASDAWLGRVAPVMTPEERRLYRGLSNEAERESFRKSFWVDKAVSEGAYMERLAYVDSAFGSGREGSGANTDQGRMYLANGAPNSIHRLPSSRIFVPCEVWYYDSLPRAGYSSRLQFLFYRKGGIGDFKLYSPQLHTIRALLVPQPGTRLMFPVNDVVTANDIRDRLKTAPGEEEIIEAAISVARGVTGAGNGEILARAASPAHMIRRDPRDLKPQVESHFSVANAPDVRVIQFWVDDSPVTDVQIRAKAAGRIGVSVESRGTRIEQSDIPLGFDSPKQVLYIHRFFLLPGGYTLNIEADGHRSSLPLQVSADRSRSVVGEAFEEIPGEVKLALTPDPRSEEARRTLARQAR